MRFQGVYTALVTPFRDDALDERALRDLVERQIAAGVSGLVPCGTTGESVTLRGDEAARVVRVVVEQARGRVPVMAGAGTNSTYKTIEGSKAARAAGADALLLVCPYYNKPSQAGLEAHFRAVLAAVPMPAMLYNIPGRTGADLAVDTLARLSDVREIVAIKEATGDVTRAQTIVARCGERFDVLSGDDALTLAMLAVGGRGVVSVASNLVPERVVEVVGRWHAGDPAGARTAHLALVDLYGALFVETNPSPVKYAMARRGWIASELRLPLVWPAEASQARVAAAMDAAGVGP